LELSSERIDVVVVAIGPYCLVVSGIRCLRWSIFNRGLRSCCAGRSLVSMGGEAIWNRVAVDFMLGEVCVMLSGIGN
jgi:hypothetical protein